MEGPGAAIWEPAPDPRPHGLEGLRQTDILQTDRWRRQGEEGRDKDTKRGTRRRDRAGQGRRKEKKKGKGKEEKGKKAEENRGAGPEHQEPLKLQAVSPGPGVRPGHQRRRAGLQHEWPRTPEEKC